MKVKEEGRWSWVRRLSVVVVKLDAVDELKR